MIIHVNKQAHTEDFAAGILDSLAVELKGSKDFSKLATGISILGYIASVKEPINSRSFSQLLSFLGHRYPKVRCNLMIDFGYCIMDFPPRNDHLNPLTIHLS